jgi:hypothetical protein
MAFGIARYTERPKAIYTNVTELYTMRQVCRTPSGQAATKAREEARKARKAARSLDEIPEAEEIAEGLRAEAREKESEAWDLMTRARLEATTVYLGDVVKMTGRGPVTYQYWYASWRQGAKVRNVYLGSPRKMDEAAAVAKARRLKAEYLGLRREEESSDEDR